MAQETLDSLARERGKQVAAHLFGQEINEETYAICKADLLLKGQGEGYLDGYPVTAMPKSRCRPLSLSASAVPNRY